MVNPTATGCAIGTYYYIFRIVKIMQDIGIWMLNDVSWIKTNPTLNWLGVRFTNATETLIWAAREKGAKGYAFDREAARRIGIGRVGAGSCRSVRGENGSRARTARRHTLQKPTELLRR